jgi:hypothetical protein
MLDKYEEGNKTEAKATPSYVQEGHTNKEILAPKKEGGTTTASKTQGSLPRAPEASLAAETAMETANMAAGDEEGAQSVSKGKSGYQKTTLHRSCRQWRGNVIDCSTTYHQYPQKTGCGKASNHLQGRPRIATVLPTIGVAIRTIYVQE